MMSKTQVHQTADCWRHNCVLQSLMNRFLPPAKYWIFFFFIKTAVVFIQKDVIAPRLSCLHPIASVLTRPQWNLRMCRYRSPDCVKRRSHHLHACGFSRVCTTACRLRLCEYWKLFPHCPQVYGFSPECVRSCRLSVYMQEKVLPHVEQVGTEPSGESLERTPSFSLKCELRWSWSTWALGKTLLQSGHMQTCCLPGGRRTPLDVEMSEDARSSSSSPLAVPEMMLRTHTQPILLLHQVIVRREQRSRGLVFRGKGSETLSPHRTPGDIPKALALWAHRITVLLLWQQVMFVFNKWLGALLLAVEGQLSRDVGGVEGVSLDRGLKDKSSARSVSSDARDLWDMGTAELLTSAFVFPAVRHRPRLGWHIIDTYNIRRPCNPKEKKRLYLTENLSNATSCRGGQ